MGLPVFLLRKYTIFVCLSHVDQSCGLTVRGPCRCQLGSAIDKGILPDLTNDIDRLVTNDGLPDLENVTAVFREYSFVASAYLLEPCWERQIKGLEGYGLGRQTLPRCIAGPLSKAAKM